MIRTTVKRSRLLVVVASALAILPGVTIHAQSVNPQVGTWQLNLAKSTHSAGPAPKSATIKIEAVDTRRKVVYDGVLADGSKAHMEYTADYDGKDNPVTGTDGGLADTAALTRINPTTTQVIYKMAGKVTTTQTTAVSADGKTLTVSMSGADPGGQAMTSVAVYDRR